MNKRGEFVLVERPRQEKLFGVWGSTLRPYRKERRVKRE